MNRLKSNTYPLACGRQEYVVYVTRLLSYPLWCPRETGMVTAGNRTFLELLVHAQPRWERGESVVNDFAIQCHFSSHGAVDSGASHVCIRRVCAKWRICYNNTTDFSHSFQPWTPWYGSYPQYYSQVGSKSENDRSYFKEKISWPKEDRKNAGKRREGETSPHSEPKSFSKKTCK
ncbi:hypothetical protein J6590_075440 [Homalodisca vitripennis]|nr:hypothetical protein J6590_075440 [Homalodisca vitripennis]